MPTACFHFLGPCGGLASSSLKWQRTPRYTTRVNRALLYPRLPLQLSSRRCRGHTVSQAPTSTQDRGMVKARTQLQMAKLPQTPSESQVFLTENQQFSCQTCPTLTHYVRYRIRVWCQPRKPPPSAYVPCQARGRQARKQEVVTLGDYS